MSKFGQPALSQLHINTKSKPLEGFWASPGPHTVPLWEPSEQSIRPSPVILHSLVTARTVTAQSANPFQQQHQPALMPLEGHHYTLHHQESCLRKSRRLPDPPRFTSRKPNSPSAANHCFLFPAPYHYGRNLCKKASSLVNGKLNWTGGAQIFLFLIV